MLVNREEIARRIAYQEGYGIGAVTEILKAYEDVIIEALQAEEEVKQGKLFKINMSELPEKRAWNHFDKVYFTRPATKVPKFTILTRLESLKKTIEERGRAEEE